MSDVSSGDDTNNSSGDPFERRLPEYAGNEYRFNYSPIDLDNPDMSEVEFIVIDGLSYWVEHDSEGRPVAQLVNVGVVTEGQVITVPEYITYSGSPCQVVSVGLCFQPFSIYDYSTNEFMYHVGLSGNPTATPSGYSGAQYTYDNFVEPVHYSIVFKGCVKVQDFAFGEFDLFNAPILKAYCFYMKSGVTSVTFEKGVTSIGKWAFAYSCIGEINVPEGTVHVGDYAFYYCKSLGNVRWSADADISDNVFSGSTVSGISIEGNPKRIGEWAFSSTNLTSIAIPDSVSEIGDHAFHFCNGLCSVSIGAGLTKIPVACFHSCTNLTNVSVSGTIREVGDGAFYKGPALNSFDFDGLEIVGVRAFCGTFKGSEEITIDLSHVERIEEGAFSGTTAPVRLIFSPELEYVGKSALSFSGSLINTEITIPSGCILDEFALQSLGVTKVSVGDNCILKKGVFNNCINLKDISFGQNCVLEDAHGINGPLGSFAGSGIEALTIPSSLILGESVFFGCEYLETVVFEGEREAIPRNCFRNCFSLTGLQLPTGLKTIASYAFADCSRLNLAEVPLNCTADDVLAWSEYAFTGTASIVECRLFDGELEGTISFLRLTLIENGIPSTSSVMIDIVGAENSMQLEEPYTYVYTMPEDLVGIYESAMSKRMPRFEFPNGLYRTSRDDGAMYDPSGFTLVKVPYNLTSLHIPDNVTIVAPYACYQSWINFVHVPSSVTEIGDYAFYSCYRLSDVEFEEGLKHIGVSAFKNTALSEIALPSSLEYVGAYAFDLGKNSGMNITIPCDSELKYVGSMALNIEAEGTVFIPSNLTDVGDLPFGYKMSEVFLGSSPSIYNSNFLRSSTMRVLDGVTSILAHPYGVKFYLPLGTDLAGIQFDQLLGCEDGCFGGYYVVTTNGPLIVDDCIETDLGSTLYFYTNLGHISGLSQIGSGDEIIVSLTISGSWTRHDIDCTIDKGRVTILESINPYVIRLQISGDIDEAVVVIKERPTSDSIIVSFDSAGGTYCSPITIGTGRTISEKMYPLPTKNCSEFLGWVDENGVEVEPYTPIDQNIVLYASWGEANPRLIFDNYSHFEVIVNGLKVDSGSRVSQNDVVVLKWIAREGYTFDHWLIGIQGESRDVFVPDYSLTNIIDDTEIDLVEGYYCLSDSIRYINSVDFSTDYEGFYLQWMTSFEQDTTGSMWTGGSGTPLVVNNRLYTRAGDHIYMYDLGTGQILKTVSTVEASAFYHYLGYANGLIFDYITQKVYDLDLNYVCTSPVAAKVLWDDTGIYLGGSGHISKYSLDMGRQIWSFSDGYCNYSSWGVTGGLQIYDGHLYWIGVRDNTIILQSVDCNEGKDFHELALTSFKNYLLDDGWITCNNNTLYFTVYSTGLFGDNSGAQGGGVVAVSINDGDFSSDYKFYQLGSLAHSNFIVYNGRGYVNSGREMYVFDVDDEDGKILTKAYSHRHGRYTHGGIVLNNPPGSDVVEVIFIPYDPTMSIMVFYDNPGQTLPKFRNINVQVPSQYNTQAVRFTDDGRIYFYNDAGNVCVLGDRPSDIFLIIREKDKVRCISYDGTVEEAILEYNLESANKYMLKEFSRSTQLDFDESLTHNYTKYYFSDVPLSEAVWSTDTLWYSEKYGIMTIDGIKTGHLYLDGEEFLLIDKSEYGYSIRFIDSYGDEIKDSISGNAPAGTELNLTEYMTGSITGYRFKYASTERFVVSPDESRNILTFNYDIVKPTVKDLTGEAIEGQATITFDELQTLADEGSPVEVILPQGKMVLSDDILKHLVMNSAPIHISLKTIDVTEIEEVQRKNIPNGATIFSISIDSLGEHVHELGGIARITLPVPVSGGNLVLWYLDDAGQMHKIEDAVLSEGYVTFSTNHLSYYVLGTESVSHDPEWSAFYIVVATIAIAITLICGMLLIKRKGMS